MKDIAEIVKELIPDVEGYMDQVEHDRSLFLKGFNYAINSKSVKPSPENYGWYKQCGFNDLPSGWMIEDGEDEYYKALKEWQVKQIKHYIK